MLKYKNLSIIGTSHISIESVNEIEVFIKTQNPDIICLELDKNRFYALMQKTKRTPSIRDIKDFGLKGFIFLLIGNYVERKLGGKVGLEPGAEMHKAIELAKEKNIPLALIDQDIRITLKRLKFTGKEKWNLIKDIFRSIFFAKSELKRLGFENIDLTKVPEQKIIDKMMIDVKIKYPNFYKTLVEDRNNFMAKKIAGLMLLKKDKKILAIVGAGHGKEMLSLIKEYLDKNNS